MTAIQAGNVAPPSLEVHPMSKVPPAMPPKATENVEDTVQLSNTGQQYLAASQAKPAAAPETVAQIIRSAAEGNIGDLSLLMVI
jgi:hypothetical protein